MVCSIAVAALIGVIPFTQSSAPQSSTMVVGKTAFYSGKIEGKFEIAVSLTRNGESVSGSYQYASQGKPIDLQGKVLPDGKLRIAEYAAPGVASGEFLLAAVPGQNELGGEWHSADGKRSYAVQLQKIADDRYRELLAQWRARRELKSKSASTKQKTLDLQTLQEVESPIPPEQGQRSPMKLWAKTEVSGPGDVSLLVTIHKSDEGYDLVRIWKQVGDRYAFIRTIESDEEPEVAAYEEPEGFRMSGEYFIHLMLRFSGTGYGHEDTFLWIAPDATLHETKFVKPAEQYRGFRDGEGVWKGESNEFQDDACTFQFSIWKEGDGNCCPSGGEVTGHYKLIGHRNYIPETKKWSADFQIVPADFKRSAEAAP